MVELDLAHFDGSAALEGNSLYFVFSWKRFVIIPFDEKQPSFLQARSSWVAKAVIHKSMFSNEFPSGAWCFPSQFHPSSDDTAIASSVPQTHSSACDGP
jgi:hypothetical protein